MWVGLDFLKILLVLGLGEPIDEWPIAPNFDVEIVGTGDHQIGDWRRQD